MRVWWQVPIQTLNINGSESEAQVHTQSLSPALKSTWPLIVIQFSYFANLFVPPGSFLTLNACDTPPTATQKKRECKDMQRYACRDLVWKGSQTQRQSKWKGTKGRHDSSDGCHSTSHFSTWASYLIASAVSWGSLKETCSAPGSVIREWAWLCDMASWLLACQRETGQAQEMERRETTVSLSKVLHELKWLQKWAVRQWF